MNEDIKKLLNGDNIEDVDRISMMLGMMKTLEVMNVSLEEFELIQNGELYVSVDEKVDNSQ